MSSQCSELSKLKSLHIFELGAYHCLTPAGGKKETWPVSQSMQLTAKNALSLLPILMVLLMEVRVCLTHVDWATAVRKKLNKAGNKVFAKMDWGTPSALHPFQSTPRMNITTTVTGCTIRAIPGEK